MFWLFGVATTATTILALALAGPIFEKIGFFIGHLRDAYKVYKETPSSDRKSLDFYLKKAFYGGAKSLIQDILVHDPIYTGLMLGGMRFHPETPAFLLVPIAFGLAVILVAVLEVGIHEYRYHRFQQRLFKMGFERETYYESRMYLEAGHNPEAMISELRDYFFANKSVYCLDYCDDYCIGCQELPEFNSRTGRMRLRNRTHGGEEWTNTVQVIYTRTIEDTGTDADQFRYFPAKKDKFYRFMDDRTSGDDVVAMLDKALVSPWLIKSICKCNQRHPSHRIVFHRWAVYSEELFIAIDKINGHTLVELKAYPAHLRNLKEAMRYVMHHFPLMQLTRGKADLTALLGVPCESEKRIEAV